MLLGIHHIAIICSDYQKSKEFYTKILGLEIIQENYRADRDSYKLDLALNQNYVIELFSFPNAPIRVSRPEALGLRHLAFSVLDIKKMVIHLAKNNVVCEEIKTDPYTGRRYTFFADPDDLPLEIYEI